MKLLLRQISSNVVFQKIKQYAREETGPESADWTRKWIERITVIG